jgi:signal transduction histidine kinase
MEQAATSGLFAGPSEMHRRVGALDWAATPAGPVESWPQSLRATIKTLLGSRYPMILLWGAELIQIYNEAYIGLIGDKHPGALGRSIRETQAESWEVIGPMIHEVMSTGVPNWVPAQMLPLERAGYREESYFSLSYSAVEDDEGHIAGMLCVCSEVTQQVLSERRTRLLRDLALQAGETRSVETTCRDIAATMAGHPLDVPFAVLYLRESDGKTLTLRAAVGPQRGMAAIPGSVGVEEGAEAASPLARAAAGETVLVDDVERRIALAGGPWDGAVRSALVMPIASAEPGIALGVLVAGVSPNRALDEGYSSFYDLLVGQVSVSLRNARAYEDERRRAEALAELDRAKTAFFGNVSHELRTPLTLMLGPVEDLLTSKRLAAEDRQALEVVHRNAGRLLRLVNTLLDFSRIEAGRIEASFEPTDLSSLTVDLASSFRSAVERAGLTLDVDCPALSQPAYVDREMWEKVVLNLLSNAVKFTFEGGITVRMRERDGAAALEVADTGTGVPASELPHLFERFHRVKGARSRTHEGSGIGLALVQELVTLHGGKATVTSTEGTGTTFTVTLPLGQAHLPRERIHASRALASTATGSAAFVEEAVRWLPGAGTVEGSPADGHAPGEEKAESTGAGRGRILVADDNADMREYLTRVLGRSFEVVAVADGQAALDIVHRGAPFDLVLTDVMMPRLGGFGLLASLRGDARTRALPVVMLSARAGEEASVEGLEAGADDYLVKPFSARELLARVRTHLEMARIRRDVARRELLEQELRHAVKIRDEFLTVVSHELRTPLTTMRLQTDALVQALKDVTNDMEATRRLLRKAETVSRQNARLEDLIDSCLDVSSLAFGRLELHPEEMDLASVVHAVAERLRPESRRANAPLNVLAEPIIGRWDRARFERILTNLIANAFKFGADKPIDVILERHADSILLEVRDRGIGIARDDQERIFGRFERAVSERHYGGLGLGLWLTRQLVEAMGGSVRVESEPGAGAAFLVELPGVQDQVT